MSFAIGRLDQCSRRFVQIGSDSDLEKNFRELQIMRDCAILIVEGSNEHSVWSLGGLASLCLSNKNNILNCPKFGNS